MFRFSIVGMLTALRLSPAVCHTDGNGTGIRCKMGTPETTSQHFLCFTGMKGTKFTIQSHLFYFYLPTKISVNEENMHRTSSKILIEYSYLATVPFARNLCNNMTVCLIIRFSLSLQPNNMTICPIIRFSLSLQPNWYAVCKVVYFYSHQPVCE